jgi:hypothetical protein
MRKEERKRLVRMEGKVSTTGRDLERAGAMDQGESEIAECSQELRRVVLVFAQSLALFSAR